MGLWPPVYNHSVVSKRGVDGTRTRHDWQGQAQRLVTDRAYEKVMSHAALQRVEKVLQNGRNQSTAEESSHALTRDEITAAVREGVEEALDERDRQRAASDSERDQRPDETSSDSGGLGTLLIALVAVGALVALRRRHSDDESEDT